jgi:hypothetical protein
MKNAVFWDITPCGCCKNKQRASVLPVSANVVPSSPIHVTLMMEAIRTSVASVLTRATGRNIPEDGVLHNLVNFLTMTPVLTSVYDDDAPSFSR